MTPDTAAESNPSWSRDGGMVAFTRSSEQNTGAGYTMRAGGSDLRRIADCFSTCDQTPVAISPNGRLIAFAVPGVQQVDSIVIETVSGRDRHTICTHDRCGQGLGGIAGSPDSRRLAFSNQGIVSLGLGPDPSEIRVANVSGGPVRQLTGAACRAPAYTCSYDTDPTWSPDGREIAYSHVALYRPHVRRRISGIWIIRAGGGRPRQLASCAALTCPGPAEPVGSPDGRELAFADDVEGPTIEIVPMHGRPRTIRACAGGRCVVPTSVVWSPDGRSLAFTGSTYPTASVYTIRASGGGLRRIAQGAIGSIDWLSGSGIPTRPPPRT